MFGVLIWFIGGLFFVVLFSGLLLVCVGCFYGCYLFHGVLFCGFCFGVVVVCLFRNLGLIGWIGFVWAVLLCFYFLVWFLVLLQLLWVVGFGVGCGFVGLVVVSCYFGICYFVCGCGWYFSCCLICGLVICFGGWVGGVIGYVWVGCIGLFVLDFGVWFWVLGWWVWWFG